MFNLKDLGDMNKIASQAKEIQKHQDLKQQEQINALNRIANILEQILDELRKK